MRKLRNIRARTEAIRPDSVHAAAVAQSDRHPLLNRLVVGFIALNAGFVAIFALLKPKAFDTVFTWAVLPPLHARFVGALYLWGTVLLIGALLTRRHSVWWPATVATAIFTGFMGALTALNTEAFDWKLIAVKVWVLAYIAFPLSTAIVAWIYRRPVVSDSDGPKLLPLSARVLQILAGLFLLIGLALLFARETMVDAWPWKVSNGVAQFYAGPFVTLAWCAWAYSRRVARDLAPFAVSMATLGWVVVAISTEKHKLFDSGRPVTWLWFVGFGGIGLFFTTILVRRPIESRATLALASNAVVTTR